jgi:hypothetical protein
MTTPQSEQAQEAEIEHAAASAVDYAERLARKASTVKKTT